jgi:uncharacterized Zn ribbon protein
MNFIRRYSTVIIITLAGLLFLQTCRGCSSKQERAFREVEYKNTIDSLNNDLLTKDSIIKERDLEVMNLAATLKAVEKTSSKTIQVLSDNNKYVVRQLKSKNKEE